MENPLRKFRKNKARSVLHIPEKSAGDKQVFFHEFSSNGQVQEKQSTINELLKATSLTLKEIKMFSFVNNYEGDIAVLVPKPKSECYFLMASGILELIVLEGKVYLFHASKEEQIKSKLFIDELSNALSLNYAQSNLKYLTLEVALDFCINHYNQRLELLRPILKRLTDEKHPKESTVARLSALINGIEGFMQKIEGLLEPISELDDQDMEDLKLGTDLDQVKGLFKSATLDIKGIIKKTKQMISRINNNIVLVDFMLDSQRNKLMRMQVRLEIFGVVCGVAAAIGGIFGMNFETSMKASVANSPYGFTITWVSCLVGSFALLGALLLHFQRNFTYHAKDKKSSCEVGTVFSLQSLDTVFSLMEGIQREIKGDRMTRTQFDELVGDKMTLEEKDHFFKFFDTDQDSVIEMDQKHFAR